MTTLMTAAMLGIGTALGILLLVRRDQLHGRYALWWLGVAAIALVLGIHPQFVDDLGRFFGVKYPPTLVVMLVLAALLLKLLVSDLDVTRRERRIRRLLQKTAILEAEMRDLQQRMIAMHEAITPEDDAKANPTPTADIEPMRKAAG